MHAILFLSHRAVGDSEGGPRDALLGIPGPFDVVERHLHRGEAGVRGLKLEGSAGGVCLCTDAELLDVAVKGEGHLVGFGQLQVQFAIVLKPPHDGEVEDLGQGQAGTFEGEGEAGDLVLEGDAAGEPPFADLRGFRRGRAQGQFARQGIVGREDVEGARSRGEKRRVIANGEILERRLQGDHERFVRIGHHARLGPGDAGLDNPL